MLSVLAPVTAAEAEEEFNVLSVPMDELILGTVVFFIVFFVLWKLALPSIQRTLAERTDAIDGALQRAAEAEEQAKAMHAKYREQLAGAHEEAADIRAKAEADGKSIVAEAKARAESEQTAIAHRAEAQLAAERAQTVAALRGDVSGIALDLAERIVGESLRDDARATSVVDRFLTELEQAAAQEPEPTA